MNTDDSIDPCLDEAVALVNLQNSQIRELKELVASQRDELEILRTEHDYSRMFISAIDQCSESIVFTNRKSEILYVNRSFEKNTGYSRQELMGRTPRVIKSGEHPLEFYQKMYATILAGETFHCRMINRRKDGSLYHEEAHITPVRNDQGVISNFISVATDITELLNSKRTLEEANAELLRSNRELEQFAYVASHDLQEPLRSVGICIQLLEKQYAGRLDAKADEFISHAVDACQRMRVLIDGLLELSRLQTTGHSPEPTDAQEMFEKACKNLSHAISTSGATVTHDKLPVVCAHPQMLARLFQNLIGNALKFHGCAPPMVHVSAVRTDDTWTFAVRDQGIGIDPAHFERIFQLFQRLHTRDEYSGTGLGLAICQKIVQSFGGRIWVESTPGRGSCFFFTLPALNSDGPSCSGIPTSKTT